MKRRGGTKAKTWHVIVCILGLAAFVYFVTNASYQPPAPSQRTGATTLREKWVVCYTEKAIDEMTTFVVNKDRLAFNDMLSRGECFLSTGAERVSVLHRTSSGKVRVRIHSGPDVWTYREAIVD